MSCDRRCFEGKPEGTPCNDCSTCDGRDDQPNYDAREAIKYAKKHGLRVDFEK